LSKERGHPNKVPNKGKDPPANEGPRARPEPEKPFLVPDNMSKPRGQATMGIPKREEPKKGKTQKGKNPKGKKTHERSL
jgi:hypothetical protein